jgi:hypothetical protein
MKAVSYTILFAILSPGLLLLVPSVFKAILKNPLSLLAIILNIAFFYMALTNIKYIPYLNTLEGFQGTATTQGNAAATAASEEPIQPKGPDGKPLTNECVQCMRKTMVFAEISSCEKVCPQTSTEQTEECNKCLKNVVPALMKTHCTNVCPAELTTGTYQPPN